MNLKGKPENVLVYNAKKKNEKQYKWKDTYLPEVNKATNWLNESEREVRKCVSVKCKENKKQYKLKDTYLLEVNKATNWLNESERESRKCEIQYKCKDTYLPKVNKVTCY